MQVTLKNQEVIDSIPQIIALQNRDNERDLNYSLMKLKRNLIGQQKKIQEDLEKFNEKAQTINEERTELCIKYCDKDKNNKPIIENTKDGSIYKGLAKGQNREFDNSLKECENKLKQLQEDRKQYLENEITIECYGIKANLLPDKMNGLQDEAIIPFIMLDNDEGSDKEIKLN